MERHVYVARHGETDWNREGRLQGHTDRPLTLRGREQALELAERCRALGIRAIGSSDLLRAAQTASIVADALAIPNSRRWPGDPRLRERGFGAFEGLSRDECAARFPEVWAAHVRGERIAPPEGEPWLSSHARVVAALSDALARAEAEGPILLVAHGGVMRALTRDEERKQPIGNGELFEVLEQPAWPANEGADLAAPVFLVRAGGDGAAR